MKRDWRALSGVLPAGLDALVLEPAVDQPDHNDEYNTTTCEIFIYYNPKETTISSIISQTCWTIISIIVNLCGF